MTQREYRKTLYQLNREERLKQMKRYYAANQERLVQYQREYRARQQEAKQ